MFAAFKVLRFRNETWQMCVSNYNLNGSLLFQRIFGEAAEKNLYLSQLIILDTLEKCLAGVSNQFLVLPSFVWQSNYNLFFL